MSVHTLSPFISVRFLDTAIHEEARHESYFSYVLLLEFLSPSGHGTGNDGAVIILRYHCLCYHCVTTFCVTTAFAAIAGEFILQWSSCWSSQKFFSFVSLIFVRANRVSP